MITRRNGGAEATVEANDAAPGGPWFGGPHLIRVFDGAGDLLEDLDPPTAEALRCRTTARTIRVAPGPWELPPPPAPLGTTFGLLIVDGLMIRELMVDGRAAPELVGSGDVLQPWVSEIDEQSSIAAEARWRALSPTTLAVLDRRFVMVATRWPSITCRVMRRTQERAHSMALTFAIAHIRRADARLLALLWHLADRWGRVTHDGVRLPLLLNHEILAQLACIRRPTASSALARLAASGEVQRCRDGTWLLTGSPPARQEALRDAEGSRQSP